MIFENNEEKIINEIQITDSKLENIESSTYKLYKSKHDLLNVYLMNLILYKELDTENKEESPIYEMMVKVSILINKVLEIESKLKEVIKEQTIRDRSEKFGKCKIVEKDGVSKRLATDEMMSNKGISEKKGSLNPRKKFKGKIEKLKAKNEVKSDDKIEFKNNK